MSELVVPLSCTACGALVSLTQSGVLWLCAACYPVRHSCEPYTHTWHGSPQPGFWGCTRCGAVLTSQEISLTPVPVPVPVDYDC